MMRDDVPAVPLPVRMVLIAAAVGVIVVLIAGVGMAAGRTARPAVGAVARLTPPDEKISAEAGVFRRTPADLATDTGGARRVAAHPRTLATYRGLRAYAGAPPRIPHGLTSDEFRTGRCRTCHQRGGYSARFDAYVPVTPHPELADCLSCHLPDASLVGVTLPGANPDDACRQCHRPGARQAPGASPRWPPATWPGVPQRAEPVGAPPPIPHDLDMRGNCLACHMGPAAVAEIRTTHPERADCRSCHVAVDPLEPTVPGGGR